MYMDVFEYLKNDGAHIAERLNNIASQYSEWPRDRVFEETKRALQEMKIYFTKEALLINNLKDDGETKEVVETAEKQRKSLEAAVENLVMIHVDEPGFEQGLDTIAEKMTQHCDFDADTFFPSMKAHLSEDDIKHVKQQLDDQILS